MKSTLTPAVVIQRIASLFWVRRRLLLLPVLLSIPIGFGLGFLLPKSFQSRTLLLLQEQGGPGLLGRETQVAPHQSQDRFNGLQALLRSDRVLESVVREIAEDKSPMTSKQMSIEVRQLQEAITITPLSSEIIEVRLRGSKAEGLGKKLETITVRLLESLLAPGDVIMTAPRLVVERRREQLAAAERAYATVLKQVRDLSTTALTDRALEELLAAQRRTHKQIQGLRAELALQDAAQTPLDRNIDAARAKLAQLGSGNDAQRMDVSIAQKQLERLIELQSLEREFENRTTQIAGVTRPATGQASSSSAELAKELSHLSAEVEIARERFVEAERRFGTPIASQKFQILRAPEQITIIDAAKDPEFPRVGKTLILLMTVAAGGLLGLGLALLVDFADPRIRSADTLARMTGAPVWGRLPATR
jgi:capsular polysaccharide biosynthesis protein